jgi:hypothetical protein
VAIVVNSVTKFFFFLTRNGVKRVSIVGMVARTYQKYLGLHTVSNSLPFQTCPINETVVGLVAVGFYLCLVGLGFVGTLETTVGF